MQSILILNRIRSLPRSQRRIEAIHDPIKYSFRQQRASRGYDSCAFDKRR